MHTLIKMQFDTEIPQWTYSESKDKMDNSITRTASIKSENRIDFKFPYSGGTSFTLSLRKKNSNQDVMLTCSKCQFTGQLAFDNETLRIKFDDEDSRNYSYGGPSDYSSDLIFINSEQQFISKLRLSKKLMIEAHFYDHGSSIIEFDTYGLDW